MLPLYFGNDGLGTKQLQTRGLVTVTMSYVQMARSPFLFQLDPSGIQVVLGYADGVVRLFAVESETDPSQLTSGIYRLTKALQAK